MTERIETTLLEGLPSELRIALKEEELSDEQYQTLLSVLLSSDLPQTEEGLEKLKILQPYLKTLEAQNAITLYLLAAEMDDISLVTWIFDLHPEIANEPNLMLQAHSIDFIEFLHTKNIPLPDSLEEKNRMLMKAIKNKSLSMFIFSLDIGATLQDLNILVSNNCLEILQYLIIERNLQPKAGILGAAITQNREEIIRYLAEIFSIENSESLIELSRQYVNATEEEKEILNEEIRRNIVQVNEILLQRRRAKAREEILQNEKKQQLALEEYKERRDAEPEIEAGREMVQKTCNDASQTSFVTGEPIKDSDKLIIFFIEGDKSPSRGEAFSSPKGDARSRGECYIKSELKEAIRHAEKVYEWKGPPSPFGIRGHPPMPDTTKPVIKLPYSGIWVKLKTIEDAFTVTGTVTVSLKGKYQSIGSEYGASSLHGQWGGHWRKEGNDSVYVWSGKAEVEERPIVYEKKSATYYMD